MRSDETQQPDITAVHDPSVRAEGSAVDLNKRAPNPMRHKVRAAGSSDPKKATDDLMAGDWATPHASKALRYTLVTIGFLLDLLLHIAVGFAVWHNFVNSPEPPWNPIMSGVLAGVAASFIHRTFVQRIIRTTLGKVLFGLRLRQNDGTYPTLRQLIKQWFIGIVATLEAVTTFG